MSVGLIAVHYPHPAHHSEFMTRVLLVVEVMRSTHGCIAADGWSTVGGDAVISMGEWVSAEARAASFAAAKAAGADFTFDDREVRPRQLFQLAEDKHHHLPSQQGLP